MSALVSRANGVVCMTLTPSTDSEDVETSPSLFTNINLTIEDEKTCATDCEHSHDIYVIEHHNSSQEKSNGGDTTDSIMLNGNMITSVASCTDDEHLNNFVPSCMHDAIESGEQSQDGNGAGIVFKPHIDPRMEGATATELGDAGKAAQDSQATPLRRISSSSIPHLMSSSRAFSMEGQQLIQRQLQRCNLEYEGTLSLSTRSRENSFVFPVDGDDSGFGSAYFDRTKKQVASPSLESNLSSSTVSLASVNIASSHGSFQFVHPLSNGSLRVVEGMPLRVVDDMQQQMHFTIKCQPNHGDIAQKDVQTTPPRELTQTNLNLFQHSTVPVLYSAINSLERYNAGSFDNKVLLAKARGMHGKQKAFPGVPRKGLDSLPQDNRLGCSAIDSISISASARRKSPMGSTLEEVGRIQQQDTCPDSIEQIGVEQTVAITNLPSALRVHKSKSSGNLRESDDGKIPNNVEELKAFRKSKKGNRSVVINDHASKTRTGRRRDKRVGVFRPSSDAYTPRMENRDIKYKPAEERESVEKISSTMGTIQRPNFRDALRRVAIILHQHIVKIENRFSTGTRGVDDTGLFKVSMRDQFNEDNFVTPRYKCSMVRVPMARPGVVYSMRKIRVVHTTPTTDEIYEFAHQLFKKVQLSSECSIVCLIYVEKLMEVSKVPLVSETWRPIFMCGLLLASKVWQDLSSWNIEFASVYPQFSLHAINRLELLFLKFIKWDLYISSSLYAKYYFALRALLEKSGFRGRYNQMVGGPGGIAASEALKVSKRSEAVKEEVLQQLSRSM